MIYIFSIRFKENSQILTSIIKIEQNISPNMVAYIQGFLIHFRNHNWYIGTIFTKQNSKISDLNRFLDFNIYYPSGKFYNFYKLFYKKKTENKKIFCKYDRIALSTGIYINNYINY